MNNDLVFDKQIAREIDGAISKDLGFAKKEAGALLKGVPLLPFSNENDNLVKGESINSGFKILK
jgi:hypothetical protein